MTGAEMHAGNDYHFLFAAWRALELLDRDMAPAWIALEGLEEMPEDSKLDVAIGHHDRTELIQVKWTSNPDAASSRVAVGEFWEIVGSLWQGELGDARDRGRSVQLFTNRTPAPGLADQLQLLRSWNDLEVPALTAELLRVASDPPSASRSVLECVIKSAIVDPPLTDAGDVDLDVVLSIASNLTTLVAFVRSASFYQHRAGDDERRDLRQRVEERLRNLGRDPDRWLDTLVESIRAMCLPEQAGRRSGRAELEQVLGIASSRGLSHHIEQPQAYEPLPQLSETLAPHLQDVEDTGRVIVLVGEPGSGKTVQLAMWARERSYPFYACRVGEQRGDVAQRAERDRFVDDLSFAVREAYPAVNHAQPIRRGVTPDAATRLANVLDELGTSTGPTSPAVVVIDGVDDARRELGDASFLQLLVEPPPHVVLVISSQGLEFLPTWLRDRNRSSITHLDMPPLSLEQASLIAARLHDLKAREAHGPNAATLSGGELDGIVTAADGNLLMLRTFVAAVAIETGEDRAIALGRLGTGPYPEIDSFYQHLLRDPEAPALALMRPLALVRSSLFVNEIARASQVPPEQIIVEVRKWRFLLEENGSRFRLHHPSLRSYVQAAFFPDGIKDLSSRLAEVGKMAEPHEPLAAEVPELLARAHRWRDVIGHVTFNYLDDQFRAFAPPSAVRDSIRLLADAATELADLGAGVRARILKRRVEERLSHYWPPADVVYSSGEGDSALLVLCLVLDARGRGATADALLRELPDPATRLRITLALSLSAFEAGRSDDGESWWNRAEHTMLLYPTGKDLPSQLERSRCQVWRCESLRELLGTTLETLWHTDDSAGVRQALPPDEQISPRVEVLLAIGRAAYRAGREQELRESSEGLPAEYRLATILGLGDEETGLPAADTTEALEHLEAFAHWPEGLRMRLAKRVAHRSSQDQLLTLLGIERWSDEAPLLHDSPLLRERLRAEDFLDEMRLRSALGHDIEAAPALEAGEREDERGAAHLYYRAAIPLAAAEGAINDADGTARGETELLRVLAVLSEARPTGNRFAFNTTLREMTARLSPRFARAAVRLNGRVGLQLLTELFALPPSALGYLNRQQRLRCLEIALIDPAARPWIEEQSALLVNEIAATVRSSTERVESLVSLARLQLGLGNPANAELSILEMIRSSDGFAASGDHPQPEFAALTQIAESIGKVDQMEGRRLLLAVAQRIEQARDTCWSTYPSDAWSDLLKALSLVSPSDVLSVLAQFEQDIDEYDELPEIGSLFQSLLVRAEGKLSASDWTALAWLIGGDRAGVSEGLIAAARRVAARTDPRHRNWIAGALQRNMPDHDKESIRTAVGGGALGDEPSADVAEHPPLLPVIQLGVALPPDVLDAAIVTATGLLIEAADPRDYSKERSIAQWLARAATVATSGQLDHIDSVVDEHLSAFGAGDAVRLATAQARRVSDPARAASEIEEWIERAYWYHGARVTDAFNALGAIDGSRARRKLVDVIANSTHVFRTDEVSDGIVGLAWLSLDELKVVADEIERSIDCVLERLPLLPSKYLPVPSGSAPSLDVVGVLLHFLSGWDQSLRRRAREALVMLSLEDPTLCDRVADFADLDRLGRTRRLVAIEGRIDALLCIAEVTSALTGVCAEPLPEAAERVTRLTLGPTSALAQHFSIRAHAQRLAASVRAGTQGRAPETWDESYRRPVEPLQMVSPETAFIGERPSRSYFFNREFERRADDLAELFRVPADEFREALEAIEDSIEPLDGEAPRRDRWIAERPYRGARTGASLRPMNVDRWEQAYRLMQGTWYAERTADATVWDERGRERLEWRQFDPWCPALFSNYLDQPAIAAVLPVDPPSAWLREDEGGIPPYMESDNWILVQESCDQTCGFLGIGSEIASALVAEDDITTWIASDTHASGNGVPGPEYLADIAAAFHEAREPRDKWPTGSEAYCASGRSYVEEPESPFVWLPLTEVEEGTSLMLRDGGLDVLNRVGDRIARIDWYGSSFGYRVFAKRDWVESMLGAEGKALGYHAFRSRQHVPLTSEGKSDWDAFRWSHREMNIARDSAGIWHQPDAGWDVFREKV